VNPLLKDVRKVYLLSMTGGLDQYLANQLVSQGLVEVVTDPKMADAVVTDSIGLGFEARLAELLPPEKPAPVIDAASKDKKDEEAAGLANNTGTPRTSSFGRGRGNVFLVDLKSRSVVWSIYLLPKRRTPEEMDKTSTRIARQLARDLDKN
jgi:hypothetical protein